MAKLADLKQQAEKLVEQGKAAEALKLYRHILSHLEKSGAVAGEVALYAKAGDLAFGLGDKPGAVELFERAARIYVERGRGDGVMAVAIRLARADKNQSQCWFRFSRDLLRGGHVEQARLVLLDYANRFKQQAAAEKLESLRGRIADEVHATLERTLSKIERRERGSMELTQAEPDEAEEPETAPMAPSAGPRESGISIPAEHDLYDPVLEARQPTAPRQAVTPVTPQQAPPPPAAAVAPVIAPPSPAATTPRMPAVRPTPPMAKPSPPRATPPAPPSPPAAAQTVSVAPPRPEPVRLNESPPAILRDAPPRSTRRSWPGLAVGGIGIAVVTALATMFLMTRGGDKAQEVAVLPGDIDSITRQGVSSDTPTSAALPDTLPSSADVMARDTATVPIVAPSMTTVPSLRPPVTVPSPPPAQRQPDTSRLATTVRRVDSTPPAVPQRRVDSAPPPATRAPPPAERAAPPVQTVQPSRIVDTIRPATVSPPPAVTPPTTTRAADPELPTPPPGTILKRPILAVFGLPIDSVVDVTVAGREGDRVVQSLGEGRFLTLTVVNLGAGGVSPRRVSASGGGSTGSLRVGSHLVTARAPIPPESLSVLLGKLVEVRP